MRDIFVVIKLFATFYHKVLQKSAVLTTGSFDDWLHEGLFDNWLL